MYIKWIFCLSFILILSLCAAACSEFAYTPDENMGILVSAGDLEDVKETTVLQKIEYKEGIDPMLPVFYWTPSGSVFHIDLDCSSVRSAETVICGNIDHAFEYGITRSCSRCFEKN